MPQCSAIRSNRESERDDDQHGRDGECDPHTGSHGLGRRRGDVGRRRGKGEQGAHHRCTGNASKIAREVEHAGNHAALVRTGIRHDGGVVGRLKQPIACGDDDDGGDVAGDAERRGHHG